MRVLEQRRERLNVKRASAEVVLMDGSKETVSALGVDNPLSDWSISAYDRLDLYLKRNSVYTADSGIRVPTCSIVKILPIQVEDYYITFEVTKSRDWNMFPFGLSSWSVKEIARGV